MKPEYALAISSRRGYITYWNGRYTKAGLDYFRAIRLYSRKYDDGFITEWWMPEEG
jgi:hypothetical protein